jgi:hypothetical protein
MSSDKPEATQTLTPTTGTAVSTAPGKIMRLGTSEINVEGLTDEQVQELKMKFATGQLILCTRRND